jgi:insertion element IS1 protein InsB
VRKSQSFFPNRSHITEMDEMYNYIQIKDYPVWIWVALDRASRWVLEILIGDRTHLDYWFIYKQLGNIPIGLFATDYLKAYEAIIRREIHIQGKQYTSMVENFNGRIKHYLARFHRRTKCYSK